MMNKAIGFLVSYVVGLSPSKTPPWEGTRLVLFAMVVVIALPTTLVSKLVHVSAAMGESVDGVSLLVVSSQGGHSTVLIKEMRSWDIIPSLSIPCYLVDFIPSAYSAAISAQPVFHSQLNCREWKSN